MPALVIVSAIFQVLQAAGISETVALLGVGFILGQGFALWGLLHIVKSFGAMQAKQSTDHKQWTSALLAAHESNQTLNRSNLHILEALRKFPPSEEVA